MSAMIDALLAEMSRADLDHLADLLAPRLEHRLARTPADEGWLNAEQAAGYLGCSRDRIYDLVQLGKLHPCRDGRRLLFRRNDLDDHLEA